MGKFSSYCYETRMSLEDSNRLVKTAKAILVAKSALAMQLMPLAADTGEIGELSGAIGISLQAGTPSVPYYKVVSAGLKSEAAFRGQIKGVIDNNVTFDRLPDLLDPTKLAWPFVDGMFATARGWATASVSDGNVTAITIGSSGLGYSRTPQVRIHPPNTGTNVRTDSRQAKAVVEINASRITRITLTDGGSGYTIPPYVEIEGGPHFLRLVEEDEGKQGRFFLINSNSGDRITLANPLNENLSQILSPDSLIEITPAWTLGSLFGYNPPLIREGNETNADRVYLRDGNATGYHAYYHDGSTWLRVGDNTTDASETVIYPDEAFIIARRNPTPLEIVFGGAALTVNSFAHLPEKGRSFLMNNPFGANMMLSDLIASENLTTDHNTSHKWYAHPSDERADNVEVLRNGVWTTFWHDGTNKDVSKPARATARAGSGIAGALTAEDISLASGDIAFASNPHVGQNTVVTTKSPHGLSNGFMVSIKGVKGYKTDSNATHKWQVDENGQKVSSGNGLVINSAINGFYEITNITASTFELKGKSNNSDHFPDSGSWSTGTPGQGYTSDAYLIFVGGGGSGAKGVAKVAGGKVVNISLTDGGAGYLSAPKVVINSGGWRRVGSGNTPVNDALIPSGAGILLVRNHPNGTASRLRIANPVK